MSEHKLDTALSAIVKVAQGRGFIIEYYDRRLVITVSHCLPHLPPCHPMAYLEEKTYAELLGPLNDAEPSVWAECLFADPVADLAVLGSPHNQAFLEQAKAYKAFTKGKALRIGEAAKVGFVWLLTLDGSWKRCRAEHWEGPLWLENEPDAIQPGMSGSPILTDDAVAVGVLSLGSNEAYIGPFPHLPYNLPGWLLRYQRSAAST